MRKKKEIAKAIELRDSVTFPAHDPAFARFQALLRAIVEENLGYQAARGLDYSIDEQKFWIELTEGVAVGDQVGSMRTTFELDPRGDLMAEVERVSAEIQAWQAACIDTRRASELAARLAEQDIGKEDCSECKGRGWRAKP